MNPDQKQELCDYIEHRTVPLAIAMQRLGIEDKNDVTITQAELADRMVPCRVCHRWTDADIVDEGRCPRCDEILNPANRPETET